MRGHDLPRHRTALVAVWLALWPAALAVACPLCDSETGAQVRQRLLQDDWLRNLSYLLAPLVVLLAMVALIYFGFPSGSRRAAGKPKETNHD